MIQNVVVTAIRAAWACVILICVGCAKEEHSDRVTVYPVSGKVLVAGKPAAGAEVILYGATPELLGPGSVSPSGTVDESGNFELGSYGPNDGAPSGTFNVVVVWHEPLPEGVSRERYSPKDRLRGRYSDPQKSSLVAEVPQGGGELPPFELK